MIYFCAYLINFDLVGPQTDISGNFGLAAPYQYLAKVST